MTVKRQFVPLNPSQGKAYPPGQASPSDSWLAEGYPGDVPPARPEEGVPQQVAGRSAGMGLLSNWKSNQMQHANRRLSASLAEQETLEQPVVQGPITGPTLQTDHAPHQSSVTPLSTLFPVAQTYPTFGLRTSAPLTEPTSSSQLPPLVAQQYSPVPARAFPSEQPFSGFQPLQVTANRPSQPLAPLPAMLIPGQIQANGSAQYASKLGNLPPLPLPQQPLATASGQQARKKKRRFPIWARVAVAILTVLVVSVGCGFYYYEANFAAPLSNITGQTVTRIKGDDNPNQGRDTSGADILSGGRFNILLLGSDDDYKTVHINGGVLAQTDIVVSIDPASKSVSMLSIPRDSWVNVPGYGMHKLDQAYLLGGGGANGAALSMATIHQDFGIYIDHYAWVGLTGFTKVIHTVGGVDVDVLHPITDDSYPDDSTLGALDPYAVKRLYMAPGPQHLTDLQALEYVRSRHADLVGDFGRSVRQQQVLNQLKYKLDNPGIFGQLPQLAQDLNGYVKTDMHVPDVLKLMNFARSLDQSKIQRVTLGPPYSSDKNMNTDAGVQDVVILNCGTVQPLIAKMFALGNNARCDQASSGNPLLAVSTPPTSSPIGVNREAGAANLWLAVSRLANIGPLSLGGSGSDFLGIHSLLDLLFLVTFESPVALEF